MKLVHSMKAVNGQEAANPEDDRECESSDAGKMAERLRPSKTELRLMAATRPRVEISQGASRTSEPRGRGFVPRVHFGFSWCSEGTMRSSLVPVANYQSILGDVDSLYIP